MTSPRKLLITARRLEELRGETQGPEGKPLSRNAFAEHASVSRQALKTWLDGRVPNGDSLLQLASVLGVTSDWLLGIKGAPKYPNQWRTDATLEADLASAVSTALCQKYPPAANESYEWVVSGAAVLRAAIESATTEAASALDLERDRRATSKDLHSLRSAAKRLAYSHESGTEEERLESAIRVQRVAERLQKRFSARSPSDTTRVILLPDFER